jgi:hypothetical protein
VSLAWDKYRPLLVVVAAVIGAALAVYLLLVVIVKAVGGTVLGGAKAALALTVWAVTMAQVLAQVAHVSSPKLPPLLASLYRAVAVLLVCVR